MKKQKKLPLFNHHAVAACIQRELDCDLKNVVPVNPVGWNYFRKAQNKGLKKYPPKSASNSAHRRETALLNFLCIADHLEGFSMREYPDGSLVREAGRGDVPDGSLCLLRARELCHTILGDFDYIEFFDRCKHGPNSSQGVPFSDSGNSRKWQAPLSCSETVAGLFELYLRYDKLLVDALSTSYPEIRRPGGVWSIIEVSNMSRLTTVPKNDETDRTIAIEPTLNMFFQQGLGSLIAEKLVAFGVDIQTQQEVHREMAFEASLSRKFATIDFSSASDCVSDGLCKFLLPPSWFSIVDQIRCKTVSVNGVPIPLSCIATMGNATTFVLETLVFYCLAIASHSVLNNRTRSILPSWEDFQNRISVFGDDCIVPVDTAPFFMEVCESVGFIVNREKSFIHKTDGFRESCGSDFLSGYNVRPVFLNGPRSEKPSVLRAWLYTQWNVLSKRLITSLGGRNAAYTRTLQYLASLISRYNERIFVVPESDTDDSGLKLWGDGERLLRLFHKPIVLPKWDRNNTLSYFALRSEGPKAGYAHEYLELWLRLKFPSSNDIWKTRSISPHFTVEKQCRGYVVRSSKDIAGSLAYLVD